MSGYKNGFGGIKINFKGKVSVNQIVESIASDLIILQEEFGIEEFSGVNFYCNMYKNGEAQTLVNKETQGIIGGFTSKADSTYKTITEQEDGSKIYKYKKGLDFDNFKNEVQKQMSTTFIKKENYLIKSKLEIEQEIEENNQEIMRLEKKQQERREALQKKKDEEEEIKNKELNNFREKVKNDFDISEESFKTKVSSIGILIAPHIIKKYLEQDVNINEKYYRVTLKNIDTGKAGNIYIYNKNFELVKKIEK